MTHFPLGIVGQNSGPKFITTPDTGWVQIFGENLQAGGSVVGGVWNPTGNNQVMSNNLALSGDFILSFNWSALGTSAAGIIIGVAPWGPPGLSNYGIGTNYENGVPTNDWVCIFERPDGNDYHLMQDGFVLSPHFRIGQRTTNTLQIRRVSNTFYMTDSDGNVEYTFGGASLGGTLGVGVAVSTDSNNATIENIQYALL